MELNKPCENRKYHEIPRNNHVSTVLQLYQLSVTIPGLSNMIKTNDGKRSKGQTDHPWNEVITAPDETFPPVALAWPWDSFRHSAQMGSTSHRRGMLKNQERELPMNM